MTDNYSRCIFCKTVPPMGHTSMPLGTICTGCGKVLMLEVVKLEPVPVSPIDPPTIHGTEITKDIGGNDGSHRTR